ncbi:MAG: hypothetical protein ABI596_10070 [Pyrinomonadaceae bacterium]
MAFIILLNAAPFVRAQTGGRPTPGTPNPSGPVRPTPGGLKTPPAQRAPSIREREFKINEMEREAAKPRTSEEEKLALAQIAEDYERIQTINNRMMSTTMPAAAPDYASIADTTAEIRKRAKRMLDNLRLPKAEEEGPAKGPEHHKAADAAGIKAALLSLDGSIMSFIKSPIFKNTGVVEVEQATRARRDLEIIVEFSQLISKDAERLTKSSAKPR